MLGQKAQFNSKARGLGLFMSRTPNKNLFMPQENPSSTDDVYCINHRRSHKISTSHNKDYLYNAASGEQQRQRHPKSPSLESETKTKTRFTHPVANSNFLYQNPHWLGCFL